MVGIGNGHTRLVRHFEADGVLSTQTGASELEAQVVTGAHGVGLAIEHHRIQHIGGHAASKADIGDLLLTAGGRLCGLDRLRRQLGQWCDSSAIHYKRGIGGISQQGQAAGGFFDAFHRQRI